MARLSDIRARLGDALASPALRRLGLLLAWALVGAMATLVIAIGASLMTGQKLVVIGSASEEPALHKGDVAIEREIHPSDVENGQIITFSEPGTGRQLSHRVQAVRRLPGGRVRILTKGDSSATYESFTVAADGSVGLVIRRIPFAGRIADLVGGPLALLLLPLAICAVAGGIELNRRRLRPGT